MRLATQKQLSDSLILFGLTPKFIQQNVKSIEHSTLNSTIDPIHLVIQNYKICLAMNLTINTKNPTGVSTYPNTVKALPEGYI